MPGYQITEYCHRMIKEHIKEGDCCVDATAGNGNDTEFLCRLTGADGKVYAFDIQKAAVEHTKKRLEEAGLSERAKVILDGHEHMENYVRENVSAITFNFGYLPGADHRLFTRPASSLPALEAALEILRPGGVLSASLYSGGVNGDEEKKAVTAYLEALPPERYTVLICRFANRPETAPLPCFVLKH